MSKYTVVFDYKWEENMDGEDLKVNVERIVEADSIKISPSGTLIFYTEQKVCQAFAAGNWYEVSKIV